MKAELEARKAQINQIIVTGLNKLGEHVLCGYYGKLEVSYENGKVVCLYKKESVKVR